MVETIGYLPCSMLLHQLPVSPPGRIDDTTQNPSFHARLHFRFQRRARGTHIAMALPATLHIATLVLNHPLRSMFEPIGIHDRNFQCCRATMCGRWLSSSMPPDSERRCTTRHLTMCPPIHTMDALVYDAGGR